MVANPDAGRGRARGLLEPVADRLRQASRLEVCTPSDADGCAAVLRERVGDVDAVVALGGDGLAHLAVQALAGGATPLGLVPAGTGNDLAGSLGVPSDPLEAADAVLAALDTGSRQAIDLGRVEEDDPAGGRWWATVLCAGFDSAVAARADALRWPAGPRRYDLAIAAELARLRPRQFLLQLDGRFLDGPATLVAIGNAPQYGGGKLITPHARLDDGRFQVTVVGPVGRVTLARLAPLLPRAGHLGHPAVRTYEATTVSLDAAGTEAYADGERLGPLPLRTSCVPGALQVLVPPGRSGPGLRD